MFRTVLVPLDGSRFAESALPIATRLVKDARAQLHLVLVLEPVAALVGMGELPLPTPEFDSERRAREESYLAATAADLSAACGGPVEFREIDGVGGPDICDEASRIGADLVVMATHGRGALGRLWLGGVADYLVRHLTIPVLLVHPNPAQEEHRSLAVRGILVALDLSAAAEAILAPVTALAQLSQAHVTLIHVVEHVFEVGSLGDLRPMQPGPAITETSRVEAQRQLDRVADRLRERGLSVSTRAVVGINAAGGLLEAVEDTRYDVVALTTHGAGGMRRLLLGSVADQVIRHTAKPVLVLRPPPVV